MTLQQALSRVCDDAERWNANRMADQEGYEAIRLVRAINISIDWSSFRGVYGTNEEEGEVRIKK